VAGCCEYGDEPSGFGVTDLVFIMWKHYNDIYSLNFDFNNIVIY
jgi:hypothetical protein